MNAEQALTEMKERLGEGTTLIGVNLNHGKLHLSMESENGQRGTVFTGYYKDTVMTSVSLLVGIIQMFQDRLSEKEMNITLSSRIIEKEEEEPGEELEGFNAERSSM